MKKIFKFALMVVTFGVYNYFFRDSFQSVFTSQFGFYNLGTEIFGLLLIYITSLTIYALVMSRIRR